MRSLEQKNHDYCESTLTLKRDGEKLFLDIGERLYTIRKEELFKPFWGSFFEYELEFKWSPGTANKLINIYKAFVLDAGIEPKKLGEAGGWTVLAECLPVIKTKKDAEHWLKQATELTRSDLRESVREAKGKLSNEEACQHPPAEIYFLKVFGCCGRKERFYPEDGESSRPNKRREVDIVNKNSKNKNHHE